jgi:methionyl aminopeptidase
MHEDPQVPNYASPQIRSRRNDFSLKPGLVIAVEPMVNVGTKDVRLASDFWTMFTADKKPSAHFEHTIAVTAKGPRVLTAPPQPDEPEWAEWGRQRMIPPEEFARPAIW